MLILTCIEACRASPYTGLCGLYAADCSGYSDVEGAVNTLQSIAFDGASSGTFQRLYKTYAVAQVNRCSGLVLEQWDIRGTFTVLAPSTCAGTCVGAYGVKMITTWTQITVSNPTTVTLLNVSPVWWLR